MSKSIKKTIEDDVQVGNVLRKDETVSEGTVFIYCGPPNSFISRYTSFTNGFPVHLKEHLEKFPVLKALFVESTKFSEFERNVNQAGSIENVWFKEAEKYFSGAVK